MKVITLILIVLLLSGCSIAAHSLKDVDKHVEDIIKSNNSLSTECLAGFYTGISFSTDNLKIAKASQVLDAMVTDKESKEYLRCKAKGLEIYILTIASQERLDDVVSKIIKLGIF